MQQIKYDAKHETVIVEIEQSPVAKRLVVTKNIHVEVNERGYAVAIKIINVSESEVAKFFDKGLRFESED